ncbi:MAG: serine hydroxymethyltransferase [Candidatus Micrarchaeota archaeon]
MQKTSLDAVKQEDPELFSLIEKEKQRQNKVLELIPSENMVSRAVMQAVGSVLTNKYSEGYPGKRYYGGNEVIDEIENLAINRAKELFQAEHVNVQPNSGSPANLAVYFALLQHGDKFMGMALDQGGHLTHGHKVNFSGIFYNPVHYGVDKETELLDYDVIRKMALQEKPKLILSGFTAYPRKIDFKAFKEICDEVEAVSMADVSHIAGLIAGGMHENPTPFFDVVTTTTHKTLRGPRGAIIMCKKDLAQKIDKAVMPGLQGGPHEHVIAGKALAFKQAMTPDFKAYAKQVVLNAKALADELLSQGFRLVSGGTDTHLILIDLNGTDLTGKKAERILDSVGINVNANSIPFDSRKPWDPSGIRVGTPVLTTRGMKESEMKEIAQLIARVVKNPDNTEIKNKVTEDVLALCKNFSFYC